MSCICTLKGAGKIILERRTDPPQYQSYEWGNSSSVALNAESTTETQQDFGTPGNPVCATDESISSVTLTGTSYEFCAKNKAVMGRGSTARAAGGAVPSTQVWANPGQFIPLSPIPDPNQTLTVTNIGGTITLVEGVDYTRRWSGIQITLSGAVGDAGAGGVAVPALADPVVPNLDITYTALETDTIQGITNVGGEEFRIYIDVLNTSIGGGMPSLLKAHRGKFGLLTSFPVYGETFQSYSWTATLLPDPDITAAGLSQYYEEVMAAPAGS